MKKVDNDTVVRAELLDSIRVLDEWASPGLVEGQDLVMRRHLVAVLKYWCRPKEFERLGIKEY